MGLHDTIEFEMDCPCCGTKLNNFQSKDGPCLMGKLKIIDVNNFYDICGQCRTWVEFNRKKAKDIDDFDINVSSTQREKSV